MAVKTRRKYAGNAVQTTLSATLNSGATTTTLAAATGWPASGPFYAVVDPGTAGEEKILVGSISGTSLSSITRGVDGTTEASHAIGATIYPVFTAVDADEANELASTYANQGGIVYQGASTFTQLAIGTAGHVLKVNSGATAPEWGQVAAAGIASDAVTTAKILDANVTLAKLATVLQNALPPVGTIAPYAGTSAPSGWLLCNGDAIGGSYTTLISLVGANTPNLKGKFLVGLDSTGTNFDGLSNDINSIGDTGGVATVTLTSAQSGVPAHSHSNTASATTTISDGQHSHSITVSGAGTHTHTFQNADNAVYNVINAADAPGLLVSSYTATGVGGDGSHSHTGSSSTVSANITASTSVTMTNVNNTAANAASAHTNVPPYYTVNYIIKHDYV